MQGAWVWSLVRELRPHTAAFFFEAKEKVANPGILAVMPVETKLPGIHKRKSSHPAWGTPGRLHGGVDFELVL